MLNYEYLILVANIRRLKTEIANYSSAFKFLFLVDVFSHCRILKIASGHLWHCKLYYLSFDVYVNNERRANTKHNNNITSIRQQERRCFDDSDDDYDDGIHIFLIVRMFTVAEVSMKIDNS